jgi:hypothetical protein
MKPIVSLVCLLTPTSLVAAIPMVRVVDVIDSRTITVESGGRRTPIALNGVDIPPDEEAAAKEYLHRLIDGAWVYIEDGNVYRSPDALYVNGELQRHAWKCVPNMRYLGIAYSGTERRPPAAAPAATPRPAPAAKAASPSKTRRRARPR